MAIEKLPEIRPMDWRDRLRMKVRRFFQDLRRPFSTELDEPAQKEKLELLYEEMMKDINLSDAPEAIKKGLDPIPAMVGFLLAAAGGGAVGMILSSLLTPYISAKLTYPMNKMATPYRFDPGIITRLYLRGFPDPDKAELWWRDLEDLGWDKDRIDAAKELTKTIPPLSDMIRFADYSAFDPEVIEKWREFYDAPEWLREPLGLVGIFEDWANKYWFSHYIQPGRYELGEMHRRELIGDDDVKLAYRTMAYSDFWQDKLLELVQEIPTRVDLRRWWDMRTIDETRLRELYHSLGYYGKNLEDYVVWTKVYTDFPDLVARYKNGWINLEEVKARLLYDGMPEARMEELLETKFKKTVAPERVAPERELTKTDITMAVKKKVMTREQGIDLLERLGYDTQEAGYIIDARVAVAGSPESYLEYREVVESYRRSQGVEVKEIPQEVIDIEKELRLVEQKLIVAKEAKEPVAIINELEVRRAELAVRYRELLMAAGL